MKRLFFLLLVYGLVTFHASAQTHFITAGQTQGMMFTDYVPERSLFFSFGFGSSDKFIDLNNDGIDDLQFNFYGAFGVGVHGDGIYKHVRAIPINPAFDIICTHDSIPCKHDYSYWCKSYSVNDTIYASHELFYHDTAFIAFKSIDTGDLCGVGFDGEDTSFYFAGRMATSSDTLLFYFHYSAYVNSYILDFAIEGQDSTIVINSTNNLSPSNISISPNPFTNQINIGTDKAVEYQLTDYTGRVLLSGKTERSIITEMLPCGSYLLLLKNEEFYTVKKMVKTHN